ncbi:ATP-binding cassette domain-containing protein [Cohnella pontilimi]|uniref:ATP-binding cassette domain-containing protein n=1 Tax=Cohnella pontilimi TaxID=2564100 RepID=A0A4U0F8T8_9BACL|nr:ATP-binding cassette domain-containing protein [Cohnella pontilimi]TJY41097.1 ATP-binding cassette domain-containing protein [Cohnella pontilimi]
MAFIEMQNVTKQFRVYPRQKGFANALKSLVYKPYEIKTAVDGIDFSIAKGELVGYIGANGAGKSTTIKMLSGILVPTSGQIEVGGLVPHENRKRNAGRIGVVFGQRSQLYWDLPMEETFDLYKRMYKIDAAAFKRNVQFFVELLDMQEFVRRPTRQLSLGQKMRANLALAMLHDPEILYLDEPTIGLDVVAKSKIRKFIREINREKATTVILTTHDMNDIEEICDRLIMIDHGRKMFDGTLHEFKQTYSDSTIVILDLEEDAALQVSDGRLKVIQEDGQRKYVSIDKNIISLVDAITQLAQTNRIREVNVKEPDIEDTVRRIFEK